MENNLLAERKEKLFKYFKGNTNWMIYLILGFIALIGIWIRTLNIWLMNGYKYIPDVDSYLFVRYAQYIVDHGKLMAIDLMRNVPLGANTSNEAWILAYLMAYMYKFFSIFSNSINMMFVAAWYPPIFFALGLIVFFLLIKRLFDWKIALLSSAFLTIIPAYLYRTMAGVSDKEPLAMFLFFSVFYLYVLSWQTNSLRNSLIYSIICGIVTGILALAWGGVAFVTLIISLFLLIKIFLSKVTNKELYSYSLWALFLLTIVFMLGGLKYGGFKGIVSNFTFVIPLFVLIVVIIQFILHQKDFKFKKLIEEKIPYNLFSFFIALVVSLIGFLIIFGVSPLFVLFDNAVTNILHPFGETRFELTVAEAQRPHFDDWIGGSAFGLNILYLSSIYFFLFFFGFILLFYNYLKPLGKKAKKIVYAFILFLVLFIFTRYSDSSIFNGENTISVYLFYGSILFFAFAVIFGYFYAYYKDRSLYNEILNLDKKYIFIIVWSIIMIAAARGGMRLFFVFAPVTAILASYFIIHLIEYNLSLKDNKYKIAIWVILIIIFYVVFSSFLTTTYSMAKYTGLGYDQQWQNAEGWVKQNTKEDAVFSHWWDYGYWVQTGFNRATVLDGGNYIVYWDYLFGRHVLTGTNETRALEFLKTHKANYLLLDPSDVGKYPAYASIGSDENYDRYAQVPIFGLDPSQTQETRNETIYFYKGGFPLDEDFIYNGNIIPRNSAGVMGVMLPFIKSGDQINFEQPRALVVYGGNQYTLSMSCLYFNGREINFKDAQIDSCLRIMPVIQDTTGDPLGAGYYLSPKVRNSFFGRLYLLDEVIDSFKLKYSDEKGIPLAIYNGRAIGPLRIYEINYPENIKENPDDLKTDFPDKKLYAA